MILFYLFIVSKDIKLHKTFGGYKFKGLITNSFIGVFKLKSSILFHISLFFGFPFKFLL